MGAVRVRVYMCSICACVVVVDEDDDDDDVCETVWLHSNCVLGGVRRD